MTHIVSTKESRMRNWGVVSLGFARLNPATAGLSLVSPTLCRQYAQIM